MRGRRSPALARVTQLARDQCAREAGRADMHAAGCARHRPTAVRVAIGPFGDDDFTPHRRAPQPRGRRSQVRRDNTIPSRMLHSLLPEYASLAPCRHVHANNIHNRAGAFGSLRLVACVVRDRTNHGLLCLGLV